MRALIVGTGPSLRGVIKDIPRFDGRLFVCNNCWSEPWVGQHYENTGLEPVWLACDPSWHGLFGKQNIPRWMDAWHWDAGICAAYGYNFVEGIWHESKTGPMRLWLKDKTKITLGHCSSVQLLNLALNQYECSKAVLIGHDMRYPKSQPRHYFAGLSETDGEYPAAIRKHSLFDKGPERYDLLDVYDEISRTEGMPPVFNATTGSAMTSFPFRDFEDFCGTR